MAIKEEFTQVDDCVWELPKSHDGRMRVPARIYGNDDIFDAAFRGIGGDADQVEQ